MTLSASDLMRQAHMTAHDYMLHAKTDIDEIFGDGYAATHPELISAYMQTAAIDFHAMQLTSTLHDEFDGLAAAIISASCSV